MAYINVSMKELITLFERNANYNRDRIKAIKVTNDSQLDITIGVAPFLPEIKVLLIFNRFEKGKMYFSIISSGGAKMLLTLISEMTNNNDFLTIEKNNIIVNIDKMLSNNLEGMYIKDMTMTEEQLYFTLTIK